MSPSKNAGGAAILTFNNRVAWAKTYLIQAGLLEATKRAHFKITDRGKQSLAGNPPRIDVEYLSKFPEFVQFKERSKGSGGEIAVTVADAVTLAPQVETPDELLRSTVKQIETALRRELLRRICLPLGRT
jgi:restriction system protein